MPVIYANTRPVVENVSISKIVDYKEDYRVDAPIVYNNRVVNRVNKLYYSVPRVLWDKEEFCLALNIYHETRGSSLKDQIASSMVVQNRIKSEFWPETYCEVVFQKYQFSWTADRLSDTPLDTSSWLLSQNLARRIVLGLEKIDIPHTHYYNPRVVSPVWGRSIKGIVIGRHKYLTTR